VNKGVIIGIAIAIIGAFFVIQDLGYQTNTDPNAPDPNDNPEKFNSPETMSIPSAQEFLEMDCQEIIHFFPEFPSEEVAHAWNTRMHECLDAQESIPVQIELEKWREVSCLEILEESYQVFENLIVQRAFDIRWKQCLENEN